MRSTAGLHGADLLGPGQIRNIKNTQAAKTVFADLVCDTFKTAVNAAASLLNRHDQ